MPVDSMAAVIGKVSVDGMRSLAVDRSSKIQSWSDSLTAKNALNL